jgi:nicotinamide mononucleotide adenylyltransferase
MLEDDGWTEHVPDSIVAVVDEIGGVERLRTVDEDDVGERWRAE